MYDTVVTPFFCHTQRIRMTPTFTLSKNDLASLLFRTVGFWSLQPLQGWHRNSFFSYPFLMIGEHTRLQTKGMRVPSKIAICTVHEHHGMALGYWTRKLVQGLHAGVFFYRDSLLAAHELMKPHSSGLGSQSAFAWDRDGIIMEDLVPGTCRGRRTAGTL